MWSINCTQYFMWSINGSDLYINTLDCYTLFDVCTTVEAGAQLCVQGQHSCLLIT